MPLEPRNRTMSFRGLEGSNSQEVKFMRKMILLAATLAAVAAAG